MKSEAYTLQVSPKEIIIEASDAKGFFYALQTIRQLFPASIEKEEVSDKKVKWSIPAVSIRTNRVLVTVRYCGCVTLLYSQRECIAHYRLYGNAQINTLHFHLTDDNGWRWKSRNIPV